MKIIITDKSKMIEHTKNQQVQVIGISPLHSTEGHYQADCEGGEIFENVETALDTIRENVDAFMVLDGDNLPIRGDDIRGRIYDEPDIVIMTIINGKVEYCGLNYID